MTYLGAGRDGGCGMDSKSSLMCGGGSGLVRRVLALWGIEGWGVERVGGLGVCGLGLRGVVVAQVE